MSSHGAALQRLQACQPGPRLNGARAPPVIHTVTSYRSTGRQRDYTAHSGRRSCVRFRVRVMRCKACGGELILTNVVPDDTVAARGVEHHTFICSACHVTERRIAFVKHGREDDTPPMSMPEATRIGRASTLQEEQVAGPSLWGRVMARIRGH